MSFKMLPAVYESLKISLKKKLMKDAARIIPEA
jgi:hypothetical protein